MSIYDKKPIQYCKVINLQLIKINEKKIKTVKKKLLGENTGINLHDLGFGSEFLGMMYILGEIFVKIFTTFFLLLFGG